MQSKRYTQAEVCGATGIAPGNLQNWTKRGLIMGLRGSDSDQETVEGAGSQGKYRGYAFTHVLAFAVVRKLQELSIPAAQAFEAADVFAHTGEGKPGWFNEPQRRIERLPSHPYHYALGDSYLILQGQHLRVVLVRKGAAFKDALEAERFTMREPFVCVDVEALFYETARRLGMDPFKHLDDVYQIHSGKDLERFD